MKVLHVRYHRRTWRIIRPGSSSRTKSGVLLWNYGLDHEATPPVKLMIKGVKPNAAKEKIG